MAKNDLTIGMTMVRDAIVDVRGEAIGEWGCEDS